MINKETDMPYVKMKIYYKEKEIYNESIYGEKRYTTEEIYDSVCKAHIRNRKINQLLK
jgi:peptide methionine sulfoxide reductase MsrB